MKKLVAAASAALLALGLEAGALTEKIAKDCVILGTDSFAGGERTRFRFEGYEAWVVEPPAGVAVAEGCPWTWTMQWATAFVPRTPVSKLLSKGWRHVTILTFQHRMDETGLAVSRRFQDYLVGRLGFAPRACLIGMSWGGFFSTRYAKYNPGCVQAIYYDCPLMNFEKGGYTDGKGEGPWTSRVPADGWSSSPEMPINMAGALVAQDIPVLLLYGGADRVVPPEQNCEVFIPRYRWLGGENLTVVRRGAYGHHPHGVEESDASIADFFVKAFARRPNPPSPRFSVFAFAVKRVMKDRGVDLKGAAKLLLDAGIAGFDTSYDDPQIPAYVEAGLKPSNLYGWVKFDSDDLGAAQGEAFVDTAVKYGVPRVMVLPDSFKPDADAAERERVSVKIVNGFRKMCAYGAKKGVTVTTEDFGDKNSICSYGPTMDRLFASVPNLAYALDSGNFYYAGHGTDVVAFAKRWQGRLAHVHLKDQAKDDPHAYLTLGEGAVPNADVIRLARDLGYCGWYTLENPVGDDYLTDIVRQRAFVLRILNEPRR